MRGGHVARRHLDANASFGANTHGDGCDGVVIPFDEHAIRATAEACAADLAHTQMLLRAKTQEWLALLQELQEAKVELQSLRDSGCSRLPLASATFGDAADKAPPLVDFKRQIGL